MTAWSLLLVVFWSKQTKCSFACAEWQWPHILEYPADITSNVPTRCVAIDAIGQINDADDAAALNAGRDFDGILLSDVFDLLSEGRL